MIGLIAQKLGMERVILASGDVVGVTWLKVEPNSVTQVKTLEKDGYTAIQLGAGKAKHPLKAQVGHLKGSEAKVLKEIKVDDTSLYTQGDKIDVTIFQPGDRVMVTGVSKGKGFAGTIKRHHFHSGPGGHGHDHHRQPGSIGAMGIPRVEPGRRMSGHMGAEQITTKNLQVAVVDPTLARLGVKGSVPGANKSFILIRKHA